MGLKSIWHDPRMRTTIGIHIRTGAFFWCMFQMMSSLNFDISKSFWRQILWMIPSPASPVDRLCIVRFRFCALSERYARCENILQCYLPALSILGKSTKCRTFLLSRLLIKNTTYGISWHLINWIHLDHWVKFALRTCGISSPRRKTCIYNMYARSFHNYIRGFQQVIYL